VLSFNKKNRSHDGYERKYIYICHIFLASDFQAEDRLIAEGKNPSYVLVK